jgi:hypothetical protein
MADLHYSRPQEGQLAIAVVVNVEEGAEITTADGDRGPKVVETRQKPLRLLDTCFEQA